MDFKFWFSQIRLDNAILFFHTQLSYKVLNKTIMSYYVKIKKINKKTTKKKKTVGLKKSGLSYWEINRQQVSINLRSNYILNPILQRWSN